MKATVEKITVNNKKLEIVSSEFDGNAVIYNFTNPIYINDINKDNFKITEFALNETKKLVHYDYDLDIGKYLFILSDSKNNYNSYGVFINNKPFTQYFQKFFILDVTSDGINFYTVRNYSYLKILLLNNTFINIPIENEGNGGYNIDNNNDSEVILYYDINGNEQNILKKDIKTLNYIIETNNSEIVNVKLYPLNLHNYVRNEDIDKLVLETVNDNLLVEDRLKEIILENENRTNILIFSMIIKVILLLTLLWLIITKTDVLLKLNIMSS